MVLRNFMKFLGGLLVLALVLTIVLGVFGYFLFRNFDPNMFRPELERQLSQQTGFRVELGDLEFQWQPQPRLQLASLKFFHPTTLEKLFQSDGIRIDADLTALRRKRLDMSQVVIQNPEILLKRDRNGDWNWLPQRDAATPSPAPSKPSLGGLIPTAEASEGAKVISLQNLSKIGEGWAWGIDKILVRDATLHFVDETADPVYTLDATRLDAEIRQKTPGVSFHFTLDTAIFGSEKKNLDASGNLDLAARVLELTLRYGPDKVLFKGALKGVDNAPRFDGNLQISGLDMVSVIPEAYKQREHITGRLDAKAQMTVEGANPDMIKRSLNSQGMVEIRDGAIKNRNLIKEVFDRLSSVLAVTSALGGELPPEILEMVKGPDTPFQSMKGVYEIGAGTAKLKQFQMTHPDYRLDGRGIYGILDNRVDGSMQLTFSASISEFLIQKIHELQLLANSNGQVMIPFRYSGIFPDASVQPDLGYIASKLMQGGTDELLNRGLERLSKILGTKKAGQPPEAGTTPPQSTGAAPSAKTPSQTTTTPVSERDQMIQQGIQALSQILGSSQNEKNSPDS